MQHKSSTSSGPVCVVSQCSITPFRMMATASSSLAGGCIVFDMVKHQDILLIHKYFRNCAQKRLTCYYQPSWPALNMVASPSVSVGVTSSTNQTNQKICSLVRKQTQPIQLVAWDVSGNIIDRRAYRKELQNSFSFSEN